MASFYKGTLYTLLYAKHSKDIPLTPLYMCHKKIKKQQTKTKTKHTTLDEYHFSLKIKQ